MDFVLGLDEGGWLVAEQMLVARYLMYVALYFHKTKRIYELHLEDFMSEWLADGRLPEVLPQYLALSDSNVLAAIRDAAIDQSKPGHGHAKRFLDRTHLRLAKELVVADNYLEQEGRRVPDRERFDNLAKAVRVLFGNGAGLRFDQPTRDATDMFADGSRILVLVEGRARFLDDLSEIVRGMSSKIWRGRVYCEKRHEQAVRQACNDFLQQNPLKEAHDDNSSGQ